HGDHRLVDLMVAVAIGMAVAAVLFVWQQTRHSVVRRRLRGDEIFSRRVRRLPELELLRAHGHRTLAYELAGALFFGTTDALTSEVEGDLDSADRFIFDFTKVSDVDISGARVLVTIFERLEGSAKQVAVAGLEGLERRNQRVREVLERLDVLRFVAEDDRHTSLDLAFEHLEDDLLEVHMSRDAMALPTPYAECAALMELEPGDREALEAIFHERKAKAGAVLLAEGCEAEQLLLLRAGRVSVFRPGREKETRLSSLGPGTLWGLSGLIPGTFWTNSVRADTDVEYALIEREELDVLRDRDPGLVHRFERVLIRSTVDRLDLLGIELALLEER
ncbi:MAG: cyclic nucleotide-binding domain-containing protein, partial [Myxococcales bacterium]|nr:cyclic nucleotide-binding domain-containing protein [Myxococcales bacterium]